MSQHTHSDESDEPPANPLDADLQWSVDGPRLDRIRELDDHVEKLQEMYLPAMCDPDASVRPTATVVYGPAGAGTARLGRAILSELAAEGFDTVACSVAEAVPEEQLHRGRVDGWIADLLDGLVDDEPVAVLLEGLQEYAPDPDGGVHDAVERLRESAPQVAVICTLVQENPRMNPRHTPEYFEFADLVLGLDAPSAARLGHLVGDELERLTAGTATAVDADAPCALAGHADDLSVGLVDDIARRAVLCSRGRARDEPTVTTGDVLTAVSQVIDERPAETNRPGARQSDEDEFQPAVPDVTFDDVGGLDDQIERIREFAVYPDQYAEVYPEGLSAGAGILLHGPPGTGKTLLAKALANELDRSLFAVEGASVKSKWFGESEQRVRTLFAEARSAAPSLLFFDEFDALAGDRGATSHTVERSIVNTLLAELDGIEAGGDLLVVAATNRADDIDPAVRRPGRLGTSIEVPPLDREGLREVFAIHTEGVPMAGDVTPEWFAATAPEELTGATVAGVVREAVHDAIRSRPESPSVDRNDVIEALEDAVDRKESVRGYY